MSNIVLDRIKDKHVGNDPVTRSFYDLYWMLVKLDVFTPTSWGVHWARDFRGRIMLSRIYVKQLEQRYADKSAL